MRKEKKIYKQPVMKQLGGVMELTKKDGSSTTKDAGQSAHRAVSN